MKMKNKWLCCSLAALTLTASLAGCSGSGTSTSTAGTQSAESAASAEPTTLRVTMALSEEEWAVMRQDVIPQFEAENNCTVEAVQVEASDVVKKLEAMNSAGKMEIDLLAQDVNQTYELIEKGLVWWKI